MPHRQPYILLVEDSPDDVALVRRALVKNAVETEVVVAEDGEQALDVLIGGDGGSRREELPLFVLLDLRLPKLSGIEVLRELRATKRTRTLPVIVLTSSDEPRDIHSCYDLGVNSYVRKPVDFSRFLSAIGALGTYWLGVNEPPPRLEG